MAVNVFGGTQPKFQCNFETHPGQTEVLNEMRTNFTSATPASTVKITCGRSWGKTAFLVCSILAPYLDNKPNAKVMWVAPFTSTALSPIEDVFRSTNDAMGGVPFIPEYDENGNRVWQFVTTKLGPMLRWWNGATCIFKSADNPDGIVSRGYHLIIVDEACLIDARVYQQQIVGTARRGNIKILMISSPRGKTHWTYNIFLKGQDPSETEYLSFQQPSHKNPYLNKTLQKLALDLPEWLYRQEYLAEYLDDGESVFKGLSDCFVGEEISFNSQQQEWHEDLSKLPEEKNFVVGVDFAKSQDYTVLAGMSLDTGRLVAYKRMNKVDYRKVLEDAVRLCKNLNGADMIFDATGVGAGLADILQNYDVVAHPFVFTNDSKTELVNKLAVDIEYKNIMLPNIATMRREFSAFTYTITRTGKISYNAPAGHHDDTVMAVALANWYRKENGFSDQVAVIDDIIEFNSKSLDGPDDFFSFMENDND